MTYISTSSLASPLRLSVMQAQSALADAQKEISTGTYADIGLTLGARTGYSLSLKSEIDILNGYTSGSNAATTRLSATDAALTSLLSSARGISTALISASSTGGFTTSVQSGAKAALQSFISALNTTAGGLSIFAGIKTNATAIGDYFSAPASAAKAAVDSAFSGTFGTSQTSAAASAITGDQMTSFLNTQFDALFNDSSWQSQWSSASSDTLQTAITPSQTVTTSVSANEAAFRQIAEAYTMVTEFTGENMSDSARQAVITKASTLLNTGVAALTNLQSEVGVSQGSITTAQTQITAQVVTLQSSVGDLEGVDTYALSSKVTTLQTQLEASYELTSRLQQLSLVNYIHG